MIDEKRLRACAPLTQTIVLAGEVVDLIDEAQGWKREYDARGERIVDLEVRADLLDAEVTQLREVMQLAIASAVPHPVEHPTMHRVWGLMRATLAGLPAPSLTEPCRLRIHVEGGSGEHITYRTNSEQWCAVCGAREALP